MLTQKRLKELLHYDPESGIFTWIGSSRVGWNGKTAGCIAYGNGGSYKATAIRIDGAGYRAHQLAWLYVHGELHPDGLDHKDGNPQNNRISNIRIASRMENAANKRRYACNTSGVKGVSWHAANKKWTAQIGIGGKQKYLGSFKEFDEAVSVVRAKREELHGEFCRHA